MPINRLADRIEAAMQAHKRRPGRPTIRNRAIENKICECIASGKTLRLICKDNAMPARSTVYRWLAKDAVRAKCVEIIKREMIAEGLIQPGECQ